MQLKLIDVADSVGFEMPLEMLSKLGVNEGDVVALLEDGGRFLLTSEKLLLARQAELGAAFPQAYIDALRELGQRRKASDEQ